MSRPPGGCFHCGDPLPAGRPIWADLGDVQQPMCCIGCKAVAEFIHANDLDAWYAHRQAPAAGGGLRAEATDWTLYDRADLQTRYVHRDGDAATATIDVGGMYCSACVWLLETALGRVDGLQGVAVNPATRRAVLRWDARRLGLADVLAAIAAVGFKPAPTVAGMAADRHREEQRLALRRLIVAAAAGMQVMMFAVALYAGAAFGIEGRIEQFLRVVSLLVCLPIVFYSARPFFANALRGLRRRRPGMDLPVSIAIGAAFAASAWATLVNRGDIYFDSVAMFVLFLGAARYLEMRARHSADDRVAALVALLPDVATRFDGDVLEVVAVDRLRIGDRVLVRPGDVLPADGRIVSGELNVDESLLTGESMPALRATGSAVVAGGVNRAGTAVLDVERVGAGTSVAEIGRMIDRAAADRPPVAALADRVARWFVVGVLAVATVAGIAWLAIDPQRAFAVVLAILVVTCPCALSLATPASLAAAATHLARRGILLVRARLLDAFARGAHVVFDKTGTLTEGRPGIANVSVFGEGLDRDGALALAAEMETVSEHVLARAFVPHRVAGRYRACDVRVEPGDGVEATVAGRRCRLGRADWVAAHAGAATPQANAADGDSHVWLGDGTALLARFAIEDRVRADAAETVRQLVARGHRVTVLSGDRAPAVARVASQLGIADWRADRSPADKLDAIAELRRGRRPVVMVGDGINDAPVLAGADASVAIDAGTALARASADAVVPGRRLASLLDIASTAAGTQRVIRQNLAWAVAYNLCAVPLAVGGVLAPWMAAIGMSASSLLVVANALRAGTAERPEAPATAAVTADAREKERAA